MNNSLKKEENNPLLVLLLFILTSILINNILEYTLDTQSLLIKQLKNQLLDRQIDQILNLQEKWKWLYLFISYLLIIIKFCIVSSVVYTTLFFKNIELKFSIIFETIVLSEFVFFLVPIIKIIWFYFFKTDFTLENFQQFYPFSIVNILNVNKIPVWLIYLLQNINLIEIIYIIALAYKLSILTKKSIKETINITLISYLPILLLWILIATFIAINYI